MHVCVHVCVKCVHVCTCACVCDVYVCVRCVCMCVCMCCVHAFNTKVKGEHAPNSTHEANTYRHGYHATGCRSPR